MVRSIRHEAFLSPEELADVLQLEVREVYRLLEAKELPGFRFGNAWRIRERDIIRFIEEGSRQGAAQRSPDRVTLRRSELTGGPSAAQRFILLGQRREASSWIDMLVQVLEELGARDATFLTRFGKARGRRRRYVALSRDDLYESRPDLSRRFAKRLANGWWLGTNYSRKDVLSILRKACEVAGIEFGVDLIVGVHREKIDKAKAMDFVGITSDPDPNASVRHDELFVEAVLHETG